MNDATLPNLELTQIWAVAKYANWRAISHGHAYGQPDAETLTTNIYLRGCYPRPSPGNYSCITRSGGGLTATAVSGRGFGASAVGACAITGQMVRSSAAGATEHLNRLELREREKLAGDAIKWALNRARLFYKLRYVQSHIGAIHYVRFQTLKNAKRYIPPWYEDKVLTSKSKALAL